MDELAVSMNPPEEGKLTEEIERWRKIVEETVKTILSLCPAHNSLVQRLMTIEGLKTSNAARLYPELFHPEGVKIFTEVLGVKLGKQVELEYNSLAWKLVNFAKMVEEIFESDDVRRTLEEAIGLRLEKTPIRSYVEACVEALKDDKIALTALKILADKEHILRYDTGLIPEMKQRYGIECTKEELIYSLTKAASLKLLEIFRDDEAGLSRRYVKYLREVIQL